MVDQNGLTIVPPDYPWHPRVRAAIEEVGDEDMPLVKVQGDEALLVSQPDIQKVVFRSEPLALADMIEETGIFSSENARGPPEFVKMSAASQILDEARIPIIPLGTGPQVQVVEFEPGPGFSMMTDPDMINLGKTEWVRPGGQGPTTGTTTIILIYLATDVCVIEEGNVECERD